MSFTTKVKETGKIFEATDELDENGNRAFDAHSLVHGKSYKGFLYDTERTNVENTFRYRSRKAATFKADELEQLRLPVTLKAAKKAQRE
jgi:hypothetical protein